MSPECPVRVVRGAEAARETLLRRQPLDQYVLSPEVADAVERIFGRRLTADEVVSEILDDVQERGDAALRHYAEVIDGTALDALRVPEERIAQGWERTEPDLRAALQHSAERIRAFHEQQPVHSWLRWDDDGGAVGQTLRPLGRVGIYAPNGRAPYPSSLLMAAIPARVAGVPEVVVTSPQRNGDLNDTILAAAYLAGVEEFYALGGAQAIAALAFGTESVRPVDKIMGPGNIFVVLAKRRVFGRVDIDQLPGPTETLLIADDTAQAAYIAADMLAQAEHDPLASAILLSTSQRLADGVCAELTMQLGSLERRDLALAALGARGGIALVESLDDAVDLANEYAAEHLCLLTADPWSLVGRIRNAGGIFVGELSSEALGDYVVGPSHIMPTGGTARFSSPVNVSDFVKVTSIFAVGPRTAAEISPAAIRLAECEGLTGHARAIRIRSTGEGDAASKGETQR